MKKRIICFLLALIMVLGMIPNTAVTANAVSNRTTSDKALEVLMETQGFRKEQYEKVEGSGEWYIGYGSKIVKDSFPNGISKEDAIDLVREDRADSLEAIDAAINAFTKKNNLDLTSYQHDALALFSFRNGTGWLSDSSNELYKAVRNGVTGNEFINILAHAAPYEITNADNLNAVMNYRLSEANMYLNNGYGYNAPSNFAYVILDQDGNEWIEEPHDTILAYNTSYALPRKNQTTFMGWYVFDGAANGYIEGAPITRLEKHNKGQIIVAKFGSLDTEVYAKYTINTSSLASRYVFNQTESKENLNKYRDQMNELALGKLARDTNFVVDMEKMVRDSDTNVSTKWIHGTGTDSDDKKLVGWVYMGELGDAAVDPLKPIATATVNINAGLSVYEGATYDSKTTGKVIAKGTTVNIYEIKVEKTNTGNKSWGKVTFEGVTGWINLAYTELKETSGKTDSAVGETGKIVNAENVNIRKEPKIVNVPASNVVTTLKRGTEVTVLETVMNGSAQWGKIRWSSVSDGYTEGWVYMYYVELDDAPHSDPENNVDETVKYTGIVTSSINLNVRKKADIYSKIVDTLPTGTKVNIYETKTKNNMKWGRIGENRWVCLAYVNLTEVEQPAAGGTTTTTTTQATVTATTLDVLKNFNSNSEKLGSLKKGDVITILEKNTEVTGTGSRIWGRIATEKVSGWINLAYVELKTVTSVNGNTGSASGGVNANGAVATVSNCISVNVRKAAGTRNEQITRLNNGTVVNVYEQVTKDNAPWARIKWNNGANEGWVCMNYLTVNAAGVEGTTNGGLVNGTNSNTISATGTVNSNIDLNVRAGAGLGYNKVGALKKGTKVTIFEQVSADGMIWGRMNYANGTGWVCMSYITVESASSTGKGVMGTVARCFKAVNVRSAPGTGNALVATINVGSRVEVFETREYSNQMWGRVAQGWVCMDYVLLDSELPPGTALDATVPTTEATKPTESEETINRDNEVLYTINGKVTIDTLNVRNDADADSDKVGTVNKDLEVKILALKNNNAELWGRIDQYATAGWVCMDYVSYSVHGYVNTEEQPVFVNADTSSSVKDTLAVNTELTITKLTVGGETVYGWVDSISGWIPMGRISDEPVEVIPIYKSSTDTTGTDKFTGTTNAAVDAYNAVNGNKVVFKLKSGVKVPVGAVKQEAGIVWGKLKANGVEGWIDLSKVNYTVSATVKADSLEVWTGKDSSNDENVLGFVKKDAAIEICGLSFDSYGNLWGTVSKATVADPTTSEESVVNGGYVLIQYLNVPALG